MNTQKDIRETIRRQRRDLSISEQKKSSRQVWKQIRKLPDFRRSRRITFYLPNDGELDLSIALQNSLALGKSCYLPVLLRDRTLMFAPVKAGMRFHKNQYGIPEPVYALKRLVSPRKLDLIFMPLVAFDASGHRIGMGGGYFDRALSFKKHRSHLPPRLIGAAHDFQQLKHIEENPWDVPMDGVVTSGGFSRSCL